MGKAATYLSILIFVDILFIATGQICVEGTCTLTSIIFDAILNIGSLPLTTLFTEFIGNALNLFNSNIGLAALLTTGGVTIGSFLATKEFRILLIPIAFSLALIAGDFVVITAYLISLNPLLAILTMAPLSIIYVFTILEWIIGKD